MRGAEDFADGRIGVFSLVAGFLIQALAYAWSSHGTSQLSGTALSYVGIIASGAAAILVVALVYRKLHPWLRNRWLLQFSRIDDLGYPHELPSRDLFLYGRILGFRPYQKEYADPAAYARRVFGTEIRDSTQDHLTRPPEFQPFAALDDQHGYVTEMPGRRLWHLPWRRRNSST